VTYVNYDVAASTAAVVGGTEGLATFEDLGSGVVYASTPITSADQGGRVLIDLNSSGVSAVQAVLGGRWVVGGAVALQSTEPQMSMAFFGNDPQVVPEPGSLSLGGLALGVLAWLRRRQQ
jgi:hypothetical protein